MTMYAFRLPDIGEGVAEGEVVAWHVEPGQHVVEDQDMVEVMTDKATVTIGAPRSGRIAQLNANIGERVLVGSVLVVIETTDSVERNGERNGERHERLSRPPEADVRGPSNDTARSRFQAPAPSRRPGARLSEVPQPRDSTRPAMPTRAPLVPGAETSASAVGDIREVLPGSSFFAAKNGQTVEAGSDISVDVSTGTLDFFAEKPLATPATRKLARDLGVDLRRVPPSGEGGRVTKSDVRGFSADAVQGDSQGSSSRSSHAAPHVLAVPLSREERSPFVGLRRRIAERMQMTKQKAAHFTFVEEVEVDALVAVLERLRPSAERHGLKLNYLPFIVKAVTLALKKHPILNSTLDEAKNELVYKHYYHIGVATATDQGLVVPVVRDADQKSPLGIAREILRLSEGARAGTLASHELTGSTFTITSLGKLGGLLATPVLNYPEVGILGVHRVKEKPVVRDGQIVIGKIMLLSLSLDHRIVDGHVGAAFAYDIIEYLEKPELLLLELA